MIPIYNLTTATIHQPNQPPTTFTATALEIGNKAIFLHTPDSPNWPTTPFTLTITTRFQGTLTIAPIEYGSQALTGLHTLIPTPSTTLTIGATPQ